MTALAFELALPWGTRTLACTSASGRIALVGPSGIGKSTVVRALAGVERRARGRVQVGDHTWQDDAAAIFVPPWQRGVAWVPQDARLFPHASVRANIAWNTDAPELAMIAAELGIDALLDRAPRNLSGGERQRVAIARALVRPASLLLLDEPFSALDRTLRAAVIEVLARRSAGRPLVLVSHDERELEPLVDEIATLALSVER